MMKKILFSMSICVLAATAGLKAQINLQNGLVAYYPLNGNANDSSGHGYNGNIVGVVPVTDRKGNANGAYHFAGGNKIVANVATIPVGNADRTLCAWVKWSGTPFINAAHMANWGASGSGLLFGIAIYKNNEWFTLGYDYPNGYDLTSGVVADNTTWHHIAGVYDAGTMKIYVDGVLKATQVKALNTTFSFLFLGNRPDEPTDSYFTGDLDEVRVYNRPLTQDEITALYNGNLAVGNVKRALDCSIYPNPANDVITISNAKPGYDVSIYDVTGKMVRRQKIANNNQISIADLAKNAQYVIKISFEGKSQSEQFLKL